MGFFRYVSDEVRDYFQFGTLTGGEVVEAEPGDDVPDDEKATWVPDHRFVPATEAEHAAQAEVPVEPVAEPVPAVPESPAEPAPAPTDAPE